MEFQPFGRPGLRVSAVGLGCWEIGWIYGRVGEIACQIAVAQPIDIGITASTPPKPVALAYR